jgi:Flp pilus assembly protein protease CpaA
MPERTVEEIKKEIAEQRVGLGADLDAMHADLRWLVLVPALVGGAVAIAVLLKRKKDKPVKTGLKFVLRWI